MAPEPLEARRSEPEPPADTDFVDDFLGGGLDRRVSTGHKGGGGDAPRGFSWRQLWLFTGPGFLMSIAYLDPGNLESALQAGSQTGYSLLWVFAYATFMGYVVQMLSAKLGVVTGLHLAQHCRREYPPLPRYLLWLMTEIAIIGSDIQEVIGCAIAISLLTSGLVPLWAGVLITAVDAFLLLFLERWGVRHIEAVFAALIAAMALSFGVMSVLARVPAASVLEGLLVPRLTSAASVQVAVAAVGAVIMPHNFYLHSALVGSRKLDGRHRAHKHEAMFYFSIESAAALALSLIINVCVIAVFAKGFYGKDVDIGLENAGKDLGERFGAPFVYIWAIGLLAAGQSSTMTGTYTGQFVMSGFLDLRLSQWKRISITRSIALVPTLLVALLYQGSSGTELDQLNQWLNVLQSVQLPFAILPVLTMTSSPRIMTPEFANTPFIQGGAWLISGAVVAINMSLAYTFGRQVLPRRLGALVPAGLLVVLYLAFIAYLAVGPERVRRIQSWRRRRRGEAAGEAAGSGALREGLLGGGAGRGQPDGRAPGSSA